MKHETETKDRMSAGQSRRRRYGRAAFTVVTAFVAVGLATAGTLVLQDRAVAIQVEDSAPIVTVVARPVVRADGFAVSRGFVGQVEPQQQTDLAFESGGTVANILVDEGDAITAGQVVAELDTRTLMNERAVREASRAALAARAELAALTTERQASLVGTGVSPRANLDEARLGLAELQARIAETDALIAGIDIRLDKAVLRAPFDGRVGQRFVDRGAAVGGGQPVAAVLQDASPRLRVGLPASVAAALEQGDTAVFEVGDETWSATFSRLRPDLDPSTRTRTALFDLEDGAARLYGQSGTLRIDQKVNQQGVWLPASALREGARGLWTVLTVETSAGAGRHLVGFEAVELLHADESRVYVRGTFPDGARIIEDGQHRVTPGQLVALGEG